VTCCQQWVKKYSKYEHVSLSYAFKARCWDNLNALMHVFCNYNLYFVCISSYIVQSVYPWNICKMLASSENVLLFHGRQSGSNAASLRSPREDKSCLSFSVVGVSSLNFIKWFDMTLLIVWQELHLDSNNLLSNVLLQNNWRTDVSLLTWLT